MQDHFTSSRKYFYRPKGRAQWPGPLGLIFLIFHAGQYYMTTWFTGFVFKINITYITTRCIEFHVSTSMTNQNIRAGEYLISG